MALNLVRIKPITSSIQALGNGLFASTVRSYYRYKDANYKTIPSTIKFNQKHYNPKFRKDRAHKVVKVTLPDQNEQKKFDEMTPDEIRAKMKEKGIQPVRPWMEKPLFISSTAGTFEPYVPPEGDGKVSIASKEGAKQRFQFLEKKGKSMIAVRKIRQFDEDFDTHEFAAEAQQIYIDAHKALADSDTEKLHQLVTERAYPIVTNERKNKTIRWQFIKSLERPHVVHARTTDIITKENIFAQVTVRLHTQQSGTAMSSVSPPAATQAEREKCVFCKICDGTEPSNIVYQDDEFVVFPDIRPAAPHHYLVVPRHHYIDVRHLTSQHIPLIEKMILLSKEVLTTQGGSTDAARLGFHMPPFITVKHLHLHIIAPEQEMGLIARGMFKANSFWFVSPDQVIQKLQEKSSL